MLSLQQSEGVKIMNTFLNLVYELLIFFKVRHYLVSYRISLDGGSSTGVWSMSELQKISPTKNKMHFIVQVNII